ncbi:phage portal protein [Paenibacillus elgii]|uniref:phage portal protein n=1 Tax=Paenibacillus elgii TaxID=189691 RepID=UPI000248E08E|nr:phage portal protein [Paenibacillus elgii]
MGLLSRLVSRQKGIGVNEFFESRGWILGGRNYSGVTVTETTAMRFATVYACVRVLAETLASLPIFVYRQQNSGRREKAINHPAYYLLHDQPNEEMTSYNWRETMMASLLLGGNAYSILTHNGRGQVIDAYPVPWYQVNVTRDPNSHELQYWIMDRGKSEFYPRERVLHIPGLGYDGLIGFSPIRMNAQAVGLGMAQLEFAERFYGQGMNIGGVLEYPGELKDTAYSRLKSDLMDRGAGLENSHIPLILEAGAKFSRIPMPLTEAQFIESRRLSKEDICSIYRVPPHMVADLSRSTNNNIEQQSLEFVQYTMLPYLSKWEQALNRKFFTQSERRQGYYVKFNVDGLLRGDAKSRAEALNVMRQNGVINADEWRELYEMNPQGSETGEVYLVNGNMKPVSKLLEPPPQAIPEGGDSEYARNAGSEPMEGEGQSGGAGDGTDS